MSVLIFILVLALLIFIHELGHFLAAKKTGMKVEEFSVGFRPAFWERKKGETNYVLGVIPIGGYVKILGENPNEEGEEKISKKDKKRTFSSKSKLAQITVLSMGVIFNILLAWILISLTLMIGFSTDSDNYPEKFLTKGGVKILNAQKDFPASQAGLSTGDYLVKISSEEKFIFNSSAQEFRDFLKENRENIVMTYKKDFNSNKIFRTGKFDLIEKDGRFLAGIYSIDSNYVQIPFFQSLYYGIVETGNKLSEIFFGMMEFFGKIFKGNAELDSVAGPVGIVSYVGNAAEAGITTLLLFTALLSLNLAVINFLPLPALDGGRVLFVLIESVTRKKIPTSIFNWVNGLGFLFLIGLMMVITFNDIWNLF